MHYKKTWIGSSLISKNNLRDGRVKNWFYLENDLLDRQDLTIYEKMIYIVIVRYVDKEDRAFPSIAKKGSMSERQVQTIINSLVKKGLIKKESRLNKDNKSKTSNLYTLLSVKRNQSGNDKGNGVVNGVHLNNTNIENTNLNNVNRASREEVVENSREEIEEIVAEDEEDINDIRRKIKESLEEKGKYNFIEPKDSGIKKNLLEKNTKLKGKDSKNSVVGKYPESKRYRLRENEQLANEIAEVLEDSHSLGAFRAIVDKISEQQIRIFLSIVKDTYLTGRIKNNRGAMFVSLAKDYAGKNNINLRFK